MRAYSMDLRLRVLADGDEGMGTTAVAAKYRVSESWVRRLRQRREATGETTPRPSGRRPATWAPHADAIRAAVAENPDFTLRELKERLGLALSLATHWRAIESLKLTFKKKVERAVERDRADVAAKREALSEGQASLDPTKLKFGDETRASTNMTRNHARGP